MINTADAIHSLRPNTEWTMVENDIDSIVWHTPNVEPITAKELKDEIARLETIEAEKPAVKAALWDRLGITKDEAKLLLS